MEIDEQRLGLLREQAFGGVCSMRVVDVAYRANELIGESTDYLVKVNGLVASGENGEEVETPGVIYLKKRPDQEGDGYIELGVILDGFEVTLSVAQLKDRTAQGQCSVAILKPNSQEVDNWARSIIACTKDEEQPFDFNDEGEIQYASHMLDVLNDFLAEPIKKENQQELIKKFRINELTKLNVIIATNDALEELDPFSQGREAFMRQKLIAKLAEMAVGEQVELYESVQDNGSLSTSHVINIFLRKTENAGIISSDIGFGKPDRIVGTQTLIPEIIVPINNEEAGQQPFVGVGENGSLGDEQAELIKTLASAEGYREVFKLPKPRLGKKLSDFNFSLEIDFNNKRIHKLFNYPEDIESSAQILADFIANMPKEYDERYNVRTVEKAIADFQSKFASQLEILDLGKITLPPTPAYCRDTDGPPQGFLRRFSGLKAEITAPGWYVLTESFDCVGVRVNFAKEAFTMARNLQNCEVFGAEYAFPATNGLVDCKAEEVVYAFSSAKNITGALAKNCERAFHKSAQIRESKAYDCDSAFFEVGFGVNNCVAERCDHAFKFYYEESQKWHRRNKITNSLWISKRNGKKRLFPNIGRKTKTT